MWNFKGTLWNSTQNIFPIRWKIWFLCNIAILRALRFKSPYAFLKRPPDYNKTIWTCCGICCIVVVNTLRLRENGPSFYRRHFQIHFLWWNCCIFISISLKFFAAVLFTISIGLDKGLAPNRQQAIIQTNDGCLLMHICVTRPQRVNEKPVRCWLEITESQGISCHGIDLVWKCQVQICPV